MIDKVAQQLKNAGLIIDRVEVDTAKVNRVAVEGDKGKKTSGWYCIYSLTTRSGDIRYAGAFGNWKTGETQNIQAETTDLSAQERQEFRRKQEEAKRQARLEREAKAVEAVKRASDIWKALPIPSAESPPSSPYLKQKQIPALGLRLARNGALVVPVRDKHGSLAGLQFIQADSSKRFLSGTAKHGSFHLIGNIDESKPLAIVEGYATGATVHLATGWPVVVAFDAGNLEPAAKAWREKHAKIVLVIGADNDEAGIKYGTQAANSVGAILAVPDMGGTKGSDFNDLHKNLGLALVTAQLTKAVQTPQPRTPKNQPQVSAPTRKKGATPKKAPASKSNQNSAESTGYSVTDKGVYFQSPDQDFPKWLCSRLDVVARTRNEDGKAWGLLVRFKNHDGDLIEWNIQDKLFAAEVGSKIIEQLLDLGLQLDADRNSKKRILSYLQRHTTIERVRLVGKLGWHQGAFLLPDHQIGESNEALHYYTERRPLNRSAENGTLEEWQQQIAAYCVGNSLLSLTVSAAFAGALLEHLGIETFGLHIFGDSSLGKTTALQVACSVHGGADYLRTWNATSTALEPTAAEHSDSLLVLDEISQVDPFAVGQIVYMLGNGEGKARGTDTGSGTRIQHRWRLTFLSSGEHTLEQHLAKAGKKSQAGMEVRLINLPACLHADEATRSKQGILENLHGFEHGSQLSNQLKQACTKTYGVAFREFLSKLTNLDTKGWAKLTDRFRTLEAKFIANNLTPNASGEAKRVAAKLALLAGAGELATGWNITNWPKGEADKAATKLFTAWIKERGGEGNAEEKQLIEHVSHELQSKAESHFTRWDGEEAKIDTHQPRTMTRWGFRKVEEFGDHMSGQYTEETLYIDKVAFRKEVCAGLDYRRVCAYLKRIGALDCNKDRGYLKAVTLPGLGSKQVDAYVVKMSALRDQLLEQSENEITHPPH